MEVAKFNTPKYNPTKEPGMLQSLISGIDNLTSSTEVNKENIENVGQNAGQGESSVKKFNNVMKQLGIDLKEDGKNLASQAIAGAAQPSQPVQPVQSFAGHTISSSGENKEDAPEVDKEVVEENGGIIPMMAQIDSYLYKYKPEAQEEYAGTGMMNNDTNLGVIAEQMNENPLTKPAVTTDDKGNLALDGGRLSSINTAVISELCRKVMELESIVYGKQ